MSTELISRIKERFFANPLFNDKAVFLVSMSLSASISSSIRHKSFYASGVSLAQKNLFREKWCFLLLNYSKKEYKDIYIYSDGVSELTKDLISASDGIAAIKLAHAQKSLSLFLKYLWCLSLRHTPVACPIDRKILSIAKEQENDSVRKIKVRNWTELDLDNKDQYLYILEALERWSGTESIAEKELVAWNSINNL